MVEESLEDELPEKTPDYEEMVILEPEREVNLDNFQMPKSMSEEEEETETKTDLQAAMKALLPRFKRKRLNDILQPLMVARIFPDNFLDLNYFLVSTMIEECEGDADIDFVGIVTAAQAATSIGYEGRGRVDTLEIAGVAHEEEMEKLSKDLGL